MKKTRLFLTFTILIFIAWPFSYSQKEAVDRATVSFSDPSKPGFVEVSIHNGGITVKGYEGKEVIVEAKTRGKMIQIGEEELSNIGIEGGIEGGVEGGIVGGVLELEKMDEKAVQELKEKKKRAKVEGMRRISAPGGSGLEIEEEDNKMEISASSWKQTVDLMIQVPYSTSLELQAFNNGNIVVENVKGEIEVGHHNGSLTLNNISGNVLAHNFNGDILVTFVEIASGKPMSFSTWNGDIDVTFPSNIKANVKMKSDRGDVYSDFDIQLDKSPQRVVEDSRKERGKYRISFEKYITGTINGGGPEYLFKTYHGDILIRKTK